MQRAKTQATQTALAISHHIIGKDRVGEHRDMTKHVVKDIGFLQIIQLFG